MFPYCFTDYCTFQESLAIADSIPYIFSFNKSTNFIANFIANLFSIRIAYVFSVFIAIIITAFSSSNYITNSTTFLFGPYINTNKLKPFNISIIVTN